MNALVECVVTEFCKSAVPCLNAIHVNCANFLARAQYPVAFLLCKMQLDAPNEEQDVNAKDALIHYVVDFATFCL